jgi:dCTP deaminase
LVIDPLPPEVRIAPTAVDLTLGDREFRTWQVPATPGLDLSVDRSAPNFFAPLAQQFLRDAEREKDGSVIIKPGAFILAMTAERVTLPKSSRLAARVEGRSSLARIGLAVHVTAPTIHADWDGHIALEIVNHGPFKICLRPGLVICQLIIEQVHGTPSTDLVSQFQRQQDVTGEGPGRR